MKRMGKILVLLLAITSLLAPMSSFCASVSNHSSSHQCCNAQAQLTVPSCCQEAAPSIPMPQQTTSQSLNTQSLTASMPLYAALPSPRDQHAAATPSAAVPASILRPATILRT